MHDCCCRRPFDLTPITHSLFFAFFLFHQFFACSTSLSTTRLVIYQCLTSADCCSKSCLSFSYKCVGNYDLGSQVTQQGIPVQRPSGAGNSGSIETSNRFGGSDSNRQCTANGLYVSTTGSSSYGALETNLLILILTQSVRFPRTTSSPFRVEDATKKNSTRAHQLTVCREWFSDVDRSCCWGDIYKTCFLGFF